MIKKVFTLSVAIVLFFAANSQQNLKINNPHWCATDDYLQNYFEQNPSAQAEFQNFLETRNKAIGNNGQKATIVVPVVVHVLHDNFNGFISKAQVRDGIRVLNEDYKRLNADTTATRAIFKPQAGTPDIEFRLATKDPNGNCTDGIVYVNTPLTNDANDAAKSASYWSSSKYFNIWLVNTIAAMGPGVILGYAQFPGQGSWSTYGFICRHDQFGTIGTSNADGRTATHEVGHCLGLLHTFQGGCGSNCSSSGDYICDTPPTSAATYGCSQTQNTCSNDANGPDPYGANVVDQIENYMSYDACQNMFSKDQASVMQGIFSQFSTLTSLVSSSNLTATGTQNGAPVPNCAPVAEFGYNYDMICTGQSVNFTNYSWNGQPTSWNWTFTAGTPSTSNDSNPTITYNTPGKHAVILNVSNSFGNNTKTKPGAILVSSSTAQYGAGPFYEGFENATTFNNDWIIIDNGGRKWEVSNSAASTGTYSAKILNYIGTSGDVDELISPSYDLTSISSVEMKFKLAFKQKGTSNTDLLRVYVSTDCGRTWQLRYSKQGTGLSTVTGTSGASFIPGSSDWREETVNLSPVANSSNVRFKFQFTNGGGNNVYIDDINITWATSIEESNLVNNTMNIYPNPSNGNSTVNFELSENSEVSMKVTDILGKTVLIPFQNTNLQAGVHNLNLQTNLSKGTYIVTLDVNGKQVSKRLVIQ